MQTKHQITITLMAGALALSQSQVGNLRADEVTDWNQNLLVAAHAVGTSPLLTTRVAAIVQTAVFDALNGIERRYTPIHVTDQAPRGSWRMETDPSRVPAGSSPAIRDHGPMGH
jgi:hypothetical protein